MHAVATNAGQSLESITLSDYLDSWLAHAQVWVRGATYEGYECLLRCHVPAELLALGLDELDPFALQRTHAELLADQEDGRPLSAGTVLNLHLVLTQAFGQAVSRNLHDRGARSPCQYRMARAWRAPFDLQVLSPESRLCEPTLTEESRSGL